MAFLIFFLLSSSIFLSTNASNPQNCTQNITQSFPFNPQNLQTLQLLCNENQTIIQLPPNNHKLIVKSITHNPKKLDLIDPENCVHNVFLSLNLSNTPFQYYYKVKKYTYLNCSTRLEASFVAIPCLSGCGHYVYTVEPMSRWPASCVAIKTIGIPFAYTSYVSDNSFGLSFTWNLPAIQEEQNHKVLSICIFIFAVATFVFLMKSRCEKIHQRRENQNQVELENHLGAYQILNAPTNFVTDLEKLAY